MPKNTIEAVKQVTTSDAVQAKVINMLDALQTGAVHIGEQVVKYSPDVADAVLWVIRIDGLQTILSGLVMLILSFFCIGWAKKLITWAHKYSEESSGVSYTGAILGCGILIIPVFIAYDALTNIWNYVSVFEPKLYLAKRIVSAAINQ